MNFEHAQSLLKIAFEGYDGDKVDLIRAMNELLVKSQQPTHTSEQVDDSDLFQDAMECSSDEEPQTETCAQVWDDTHDRVVTCGDVSLRFVKSGGKRHHRKSNIEITCGLNVWNEGHGWLTEVHGGRIYHVGHKPTDIRCYILREVNRIPGSIKGNWVWDQPGLPADLPIAAQMIAEVKRRMNFN